MGGRAGRPRTTLRASPGGETSPAPSAIFRATDVVSALQLVGKISTTVRQPLDKAVGNSHEIGRCTIHVQSLVRSKWFIL